MRILADSENYLEGFLQFGEYVALQFMTATDRIMLNQRLARYIFFKEQLQVCYLKVCDLSCIWITEYLNGCKYAIRTSY